MGFSQPPPDVVVVGGGVIGLATAWRAASRYGLRVTVADPAPGRGASHVAAGMLAPVSELGYGEQELLRLNLDSAARYPAFAEELESASGLSPGYRACGTLAVAFDADDRVALKELHTFQAKLGLESTWLTGRECRRLEPMLAPAVSGGLQVAGDHQIDNRRLVAALLAACTTAGVTFVRRRVVDIVTVEGTAVGVRLDTGAVLAAGQTLLAAGCHSATVGGLPPEAVPPVRPVKGEILRLRMDPAHPLVSRTVRGMVRGTGVYLAPRADGELVVGATQYELGFNTEVTAGGVYELLRDARALVPGITELPLQETIAGLRPGTPDNAPLIGPSSVPGLVVATGHHRHGVLLTPVTADTVAELLATGEVPEPVSAFGPGRFTTVCEVNA